MKRNPCVGRFGYSRPVRRTIPLLVALLVACTPAESPPATAEVIAPLPSAQPAVQPEAPPPLRTRLLPSGLQIEQVRQGHGNLAARGRHVVVHYVGTLVDGKQFDTSRGRGPFEFILGSGQVIKGWDEGVEGMREGEIRRLTIPPELGYGDRGHPPKIPAGSTLIFEIELLEVR